ncbi:UNVERIFIED_CONTAM: adenosylcobinamide kinase /adenosylcobinamide-phosphate guanylyltransferase [Acetivibrio alkalicellulosi]
MGKVILVTGGSRSGKSSFAESIAKKYGNNVLYIATSIPFDDEMKIRVRKHREQRPEYWQTLEAYKDFDIYLKEHTCQKEVLLLDCITLMVTNIILEERCDWEKISLEEVSFIERRVEKEVEKLLHEVEKGSATLIAVTNEVGMGIIPSNRLSRIFSDIAGRINQKLAKVADEVFLCVSGIPIKIKD